MAHGLYLWSSTCWHQSTLTDIPSTPSVNAHETTLQPYLIHERFQKWISPYKPQCSMARSVDAQVDAKKAREWAELRVGCSGASPPPGTRASAKSCHKLPGGGNACSMSASCFANRDWAMAGLQTQIRDLHAELWRVNLSNRSASEEVAHVIEELANNLRSAGAEW